MWKIPKIIPSEIRVKYKGRSSPQIVLNISPMSTLADSKSKTESRKSSFVKPSAQTDREGPGQRGRTLFRCSGLFVLYAIVCFHCDRNVVLE